MFFLLPNIVIIGLNQPHIPVLKAQYQHLDLKQGLSRIMWYLRLAERFGWSWRNVWKLWRGQTCEVPKYVQNSWRNVWKTGSGAPFFDPHLKLSQRSDAKPLTPAPPFPASSSRMFKSPPSRALTALGVLHTACRKCRKDCNSWRFRSVAWSYAGEQPTSWLGVKLGVAEDYFTHDGNKTRLEAFWVFTRANSMCPCLGIFWDWWETWMVFPRHPMGILWPYGFPKPTIPHPSCSPNVPWPAVVAQHPPQPAPRSRLVAADPSGCCWRAGSGAPPGVPAASYPAGWPHSTAVAGSGAPPPRRRSPELCRKRATSEAILTRMMQTSGTDKTSTDDVPSKKWNDDLS